MNKNIRTMLLTSGILICIGCGKGAVTPDSLPATSESSGEPFGVPTEPTMPTEAVERTDINADEEQLRQYRQAAITQMPLRKLGYSLLDLSMLYRDALRTAEKVNSSSERGMVSKAKKEVPARMQIEICQARKEIKKRNFKAAIEAIDAATEIFLHSIGDDEEYLKIWARGKLVVADDYYSRLEEIVEKIRASKEGGISSRAKEEAFARMHIAIGKAREAFNKGDFEATILSADAVRNIFYEASYHPAGLVEESNMLEGHDVVCEVFPVLCKPMPNIANLTKICEIP